MTVRPRMLNYRLPRPMIRGGVWAGLGARRPGAWAGMGVCSAATPGDCAGPYSSPMANYNYQLNLQQTGDVQETPIYSPPAPYTPGGPGEANCTHDVGGLQWVDSACVAAQQQRSIDYQNQIAAAQLAYNLQGCLNGQTPADVCRARYPGVTPSGNMGPGVTSPTPPPSAPPPASTPPPVQLPVANPIAPPVGAPIGIPGSGTAVTGPSSSSFSFARAFNCDPAQNEACILGFPTWLVLAASVGVGVLVFGGKR